jgi:hypothetical protein
MTTVSPYNLGSNFPQIEFQEVNMHKIHYIECLQSIYGPYSRLTISAIKSFSTNFMEFVSSLTEILNIIRYCQQEPCIASVGWQLLQFFVK